METDDNKNLNDYSLKEHHSKLNELINLQREELSKTINRKCLFCSKVFEQRVAELFDHMFHAHNFNMGFVDNLVFIEKLLNTLEEKLSNLQCIYCEKFFKCRKTLKEHMRKKKHYRIKSKNAFYDQFYLENYLKERKDSNNDIENDELSDILEESQGSNEWDDWNEENIDESICLFCDHHTSTSKDCFEHMLTVHEFDFKEYKKNLGFNYYNIVKLINFTRYMIKELTCPYCFSSFHSHDELILHLNSLNHYKIDLSKENWKDSKYLYPIFENDSLLMEFIGSDDEDIYDIN